MSRYALTMEPSFRAAARLVAEAAAAAREHGTYNKLTQQKKTAAVFAARSYFAAASAQLALAGDDRNSDVAQEARLEKFVAVELVRAAHDSDTAQVDEDWWAPARCPAPLETWNDLCATAPEPGVPHRCAWCPWGAK